MGLASMLNPEVERSQPGPLQAPHTANSESRTPKQRPPGLGFKSPNHHLEKILPREERELLTLWRKEIIQCWAYVEEWRVLLFYGIVEDEDTPWKFAFQDGIMSEFSGQIDEDLAAPHFDGLYFADRPFKIVPRTNLGSNATGLRNIQNLLGDTSLDILRIRTEKPWDFVLSNHPADASNSIYLAMLYKNDATLYVNHLSRHKHWDLAADVNRHRMYAVYAASCFFGRTPGFIEISKDLPRKLNDNCRPLALPVELQLQALDHLPLWEADLVVHRLFPHLVKKWLTLLPSRVMTFIDDFCCRENLKYVGTQVKRVRFGIGAERPIRVDLYRPRHSPTDMKSSFILPGHSEYGNEDGLEGDVVNHRPAIPLAWNSGFAFSTPDCPSLHYSKQALLSQLDDFLSILKSHDISECISSDHDQAWRDNVSHSLDHFTRRGCQLEYHDRVTKRRNDPQWRHAEECKTCLDEIDIKNTPFFIRLSSSGIQSPDIIPAIQYPLERRGPIRTIKAMQSLILLRHELELVLKNLQLLRRPGFLYRQLHVYYAPGLPTNPTSNSLHSAIFCGIDAVCMREVPINEMWRCKHERVPDEWLKDRGTAAVLLRNYPSPEHRVFNLPRSFRG